MKNIIDRFLDWSTNRRWLVVTGVAGTVLGIATEVLESWSDVSAEVQGVGIWQALPILLAFAGQMKANSNRYLDDVRAEIREATIEEFDDPTAQDV